MTQFRIMVQHRFSNADGKTEICRVESEEVAKQLVEKLRKETFVSGGRRFRRYGKTAVIERIET